MGRPKMHMAGDRCVPVGGVSVLQHGALKLVRVQHVGMLLMIACGALPSFLRNEAVAWDVNSSPPSEVSSTLIPCVRKIRRRAAMSPAAPWDAPSTMSQLLYLSTTIRLHCWQRARIFLYGWGHTGPEKDVSAREHICDTP